MTKKNNLIRDMTEAFKEIEILADNIHSIGDLMSLLIHAEDASINHLTAAWIGNRIKIDALKIISLLDNALGCYRNEDDE
jgi:hypothetical protein